MSSVRFLIFFLAAASLFAESIDFNTNGRSYELTATRHTRINTQTNGHFNLGYVYTYDQADRGQELIYFEKEALNKRPYKNWTFGLGTKLLYADIGMNQKGGTVTALPIKAEAFYHVPLRRKLYATFTYYYAPSFLVFSDHFKGYDESRIEVTVGLTRNTKAYLGGKSTHIIHKNEGSYELANAGFIGLRYRF